MSASSPATKGLKTKDPKTQALQKALSKAIATARAEVLCFVPESQFISLKQYLGRDC